MKAAGFPYTKTIAEFDCSQLNESVPPLFLQELSKADLLILDELSYFSFNRDQSKLPIKVFSNKSEKSSTIVTTNLSFS